MFRMEVEKFRGMVGNGVIEKDNGAVRIAGFMDFGEEVKSGGTGIGDMEERNILGGKTMKGTMF